MFQAGMGAEREQMTFEPCPTAGTPTHPALGPGTNEPKLRPPGPCGNRCSTLRSARASTTAFTAAPSAGVVPPSTPPK
jgi:hypothetical protein